MKRLKYLEGLLDARRGPSVCFVENKKILYSNGNVVTVRRVESILHGSYKDYKHFS